MTRSNALDGLVNRLRQIRTTSKRPSKRPNGDRKVAQESETYTNEQLHEFLHCWTLPGGTLPPDQARALLAWRETPDEERRALKASIAATEQQVEAKRLAPDQRRGHVSWLDRLKHLVGR